MGHNTISLKTRFRQTAFYQFLKKHKRICIASAIVIALVLIFTLPYIDYGTSPRGNYSHAFETYKNEINSQNLNNEYKANVINSDNSIKLETINGKENAFAITNGENVSYAVNVVDAGDYEIYLDFCFAYDINSGFQDSEFEVLLDGNQIIERTKLRALWQNETNEFEMDSYSNQLVPTQEIIREWQNDGLYSYDFNSALPLNFNFSSGEHTITLNCINGDMIALGDLYLRSKSYLPSYSEYSANFEGIEEGTRIEDIEGEFFSSKNDTSPIPTNSPDINAYPYDTVKRLLNTVSNFNASNQEISFDFDIQKTGLYNINLNASVSNSNHTTFATIFIDGEVPFGELMHYPFENRDDMYEYVLSNNEGNPFQFYLESGRHTLTIKIDKGLFKDITALLDSCNTELNSIYLNLKKIAGTVQDNNKEWDPETDFPGTIERIEYIVESLESTIPELYKINGSEANFQAIIYIRSAISSLRGILDEPRLIPNNYGKFSEGTGSIIENISNAKTDLETTPLDIDRIIIGPQNDCRLSVKFSKFDFLVENIKKFFLSFTTDYSGGMNNSDEKTLNIWVARSRQYVDLMQQIFDGSDFKERTGYNVKFTLLADESKLILSNAAGISPDGVMGISNWLPYEMGIRGLTVDLTEFEDYGDVISRFSPGSLISLIADGIGLGLPETQDFYVTYYREDIMDQYGIDVPNTWQDVIEILPELQRNGFNYYIPLSTSTASKSIMSTAPFIYQYGGNLFSDDGTRTTIDEENSINAIKLMTELYTLYGLEDQVSNFFNSFRNGGLPIGVSTFDTYVRLTIAAPEIAGKWKIALPPGVDNGNEIVRWQTGSAQSMCLIDKGEEVNNAGWELLKWWTSSEVQAEFANRLTLLYGKGYIWNSANLEAFSQSMVFTSQEKATILEEWEWMREIPRVPGWYMLERELSNSWNDIVLNAQNTRAVIEDAVTVINNELQRKLIEFGYLDDNGNTIKPYKVTTLESIAELKRS